MNKNSSEENKVWQAETFLGLVFTFNHHAVRSGMVTFNMFSQWEYCKPKLNLDLNRLNFLPIFFWELMKNSITSWVMDTDGK